MNENLKFYSYDPARISQKLHPPVQRKIVLETLQAVIPYQQFCVNVLFAEPVVTIVCKVSSV